MFESLGPENGASDRRTLPKRLENAVAGTLASAGTLACATSPSSSR
jgi:hypothetical protein